MSNLLSLLSLGSGGIAAQNTGIAVATNNVANANTVGFSRQRVDLESLLAAPLVGGVRSGTPDRLQDNLLAGRIRSSAGALSGSRTFAETVLDVESRIGSGPTVHEQLGELFSRISQVSASPTDTTMRSAVVSAARELTVGIHSRAAELAAASKELDTRVLENAGTANGLIKRLADTNTAVARTNDPVLRDERERLATQLSELVGGAARIDADGQMRFVLDDGAVLVDAGRAATLVGTPDATTGTMHVEVVDGAIRRDVTTAITEGRIGAQLAARDGTIARAVAELDQLAFDVGEQFNTVYSANAGLDGVSGRTMFVPSAGPLGAAAALALDPGLDADSTQLALADPASGPGDNRGALGLLALSSAPVAAGGKTLTGAALDIVSSIGAQASEAKTAVSRDELVAENLAGLRDSLAGVDVQEELTNLARFEHASSAMTRFVSTIDNLLGDLIDRL